MRVNILENFDQLSELAATEMIRQVQIKPESVIVVASGDTPRMAYSQLAARKSQGADFSRVTFLGLDEWVGIAPTNKGSCHFFLTMTLFTPLGLNASQVHLFDGRSQDLPGECAAMDEIINEKGGIDLMVVGIGMNGHIGFNEPGTLADTLSHVTHLDPVTRRVGQKYFDGESSLAKGITIGLRHIMNSKKVILMANGEKKAGVIRATLRDGVTTAMPASLLRRHSNSLVLLDPEAASLLGGDGKKGSFEIHG